ncbi:MAG: acyl-CoA dehydrogenase family protein [Chitinispirillia bacterium]|jgi:alkylation response protein AidB-like acyl-CoA dehydrogenase
MEKSDKSSYKKGGSFLIEKCQESDIYSAEDFTEEHVMIQDTVRKFVENDIKPKIDRIEKLDYDLSVSLLKNLGELGMLGVDISEDYGGGGMDKITNAIVTEELGRAGSFSVTIGAHVGIGTLPVAYYGSKEQKKKYLTGLISGELIGAYALTEPGSGSDALAAKTKAVLSGDKKHFVLNGTKQFITNAGFASIFIVFAKIAGEQFSAFIVERSFEGVSIGEEEKKLGIKGSSTCALILENAKIPVENLLGKPGDGTKIALNILNIGRLKLGLGCLGICKDIINDTLSYASQREQFGKTINRFGLIQEKIANMAIKIFALESSSYRTIGLIQKLVDGIDHKADDAERKILKSIEEYSIECAIMKIYGSETLDFVCDEGLQTYGGYGYTQEYPMERYYRDSRINRIFEGTNEINRLVITGMLMKKGLKGELDLMGAIKLIQREITEFPSLTEDSGELMEQEIKILENMKKAVLLISGAAIQKYNQAIENEQEILAMISDCITEIYNLESLVLRSLKIAGKRGEEKSGIYLDITRAYCFDAVQKVDSKLKLTSAAISGGDDLRILLGAIKRFIKYSPPDLVKAKRNIASHLIKAGIYQL